MTFLRGRWYVGIPARKKHQLLPCAIFVNHGVPRLQPEPMTPQSSPYPNPPEKSPHSPKHFSWHPVPKPNLAQKLPPKKTVAQPPQKIAPPQKKTFGRENSSFLAVAVADLSGYLFKTAQRIASREIS